MTRPAIRRLLTLPAIAMLAAALSAAPATAAVPSQRSIVVLDEGVDAGAVAREHAARFDLDVGFVYRHALRGYSAAIPATALRALRADTRVAFVERDGAMRASATQTGATWGIDRTDQVNLPLSTTYTYTRTGSGVTAYVIDTGIRRTHAQFGGRAVHGYNAALGLSSDDCNGHGTHVAGTIGGSTYGIAKQVRLVAVRVLDCTGFGSTSGVIAGVDWVTGNHLAGQPAVANMSLGGGASTALDNAVKASIADGVSYAIAAGNGDDFGNPMDACTQSPARVAAAMTISATDKADRRASWANTGSCVDWFAPGVSITSAWFYTDTSTNTISGTSMATPHTAGVAAQYLQGTPGASPAQVTSALSALTTKGKVTAANSTNNHLLFTNL